MTVKVDYFPFKGGLDLVTPTLSMPPGRLLGSQNYEIGVNEGYRRIDGFERFDGMPKPSDASYWLLEFDAGDTEVTEGDTVTGGTSGATGVALIDAVLDSGTYVGGDAAGHLILTGVSGTFQDNEDLEVAAAKVAECDGTLLQRGASTDTLDTTYYRDAVETARTAIAAVPGSGSMRGVWILNNVVYAIRDNAGGTAAAMYKSTTAGWVLCDLGYTLDFDAGSAAFAVNEVVTGASSAAYGTVKKIVVESGTWVGGDAAGYMVLYSDSDTPFTDNESLSGSVAGVAVADGTGSDNAFSAGGRFEFRNYNFAGHSSSSLKMYGVNGSDKAFEWDGSVFTWIPTGMTTDTPNHLEVHLNYLFLFFTGGSIQHSGIGDPTAWSVLLGASEISAGDSITGALVLPGMVMAVFCRNSTKILYGSSPQDWFLRDHTPTRGAIEWSIQMGPFAIYLDDRGLTKLVNTDTSGNFADNTFSEMVQARFDSKKSLTSASVLVQSKNQYIIYFTDNTAMSCTFKGGKLAGFVDLDYGVPVRCIVSGENSAGGEQVFFGADDGYIYELNKGTSLDGDEVGAFLRTSYNHFKTPRNYKQFYRIFLELNPSADPNIALQFAPDFSYGDPDIPTPVPQDYELEGGGGFWNSSDWNNFYWSGQAVATLESHIDGLGVNMSLLINSSAVYERPHSIHGAVIHYSVRGMKR